MFPTYTDFLGRDAEAMTLCDFVGMETAFLVVCLEEAVSVVVVLGCRYVFCSASAYKRPGIQKARSASHCYHAHYLRGQ